MASINGKLVQTKLSKFGTTELTIPPGINKVVITYQYTKLAIASRYLSIVTLNSNFYFIDLLFLNKNNQEEKYNILTRFLFKKDFLAAHINRLKSLFYIFYFFNLLHTLFNIDIYIMKHVFSSIMQSIFIDNKLHPKTDLVQGRFLLMLPHFAFEYFIDCLLSAWHLYRFLVMFP